MVEPVLTVDGYLFPIVDAADLLTDDEENALASHIYDVEEQFQSAIVMVTVDTLGTRTVEEYGDDFYDYNGYGFGENHDGILFLIDMETRSWHITTTGSAIGVYNDSAQEDLIDACKYNLSQGNYYQSFDEFISECNKILQSDLDSHTFTSGKLTICIIAGLLLALIPLLGFIGQLHTVHPEKGAANYSQQGLSLTGKHDRFVRKTTSRTKIQKESSSTHTGSSGTSHGGSSGHF
ncbi:TPM domain-containing protein [Butyrivibrio sp. VCD2006]|uniref:TPM domain-containing protein n=1 Tax=Butyrivibrio sp. VCD2006 TaxID=1280664 RepID=UPI003FA4A1D0